MSDLDIKIKDGDLEGAMELIGRSDIDVNEENSSNETPLHLACEKGYLALVNKLLTAPRIDVNASGPYGLTPLHYASMEGKTGAVQLLIEKGSNLEFDAQDAKGQTPLWMAIYWKRLDTMKTLLEAGACVGSKETELLQMRPKMKKIVEEMPVQLAEIPALLAGITDKTLSEGADVSLSCKFYPGLPQPEILWYCDDAEILQSERLLISATATRSGLFIIGATVEDSGLYRCVISNEAGEIHSEAKITVIKQEEIAEEVRQKLGESPEKFKEDILNEMKEELTNSIKEIEDKMSHLKEVLAAVVSMSSENVKSHINLNVTKITTEIQANAKDQVAKVTQHTTEQFAEMKKTAEHNEFLFYKMFMLLSKQVGECVGKWEELGSHLLDSLPSAEEVISAIDHNHTTEREKALEVMIYWKVFSGINDVDTLNETFKKIGLQDINGIVNQTVRQYEQNQDRCYTGSLTEEGLCALADEIGNEWHQLGIILGLKSKRCEQLQHNHPDLPHLTTVMLIEWRNSTSGSVEDKLKKLKKALRKIHRKDLAKTLTT